jgi:hypothetical protein
MEKVAALRRLFAEYGYAPTGADDGMTKEAVRRLVKALNSMGARKFQDAANRALRSVNATQRAIFEKNSPASLARWEKARRTLSAKPQRKAFGATIYTGRDKALAAMDEYVNKARIAPSRAKGFDLLYSSPRRYYDIDGRWRKPRARPGTFARLFGTGRTVEDLLSKYQSFQPKAPELRVRPVHPALAYDALMDMHNRSLSSHELKRLTDGLVDRGETAWRGIFNPSGVALGKPVFGDGKEYVHVAPSPDMAWQYAGGGHLKEKKFDPRYAAIRDKPNTLAGIMQSAPTRGALDEKLMSLGIEKPNFLLYGRDFSAEDFLKGKLSLKDLIRERRGYSKEFRDWWRNYNTPPPPGWDLPRHETRAKFVPGGEKSYLRDWDNNVYNPVKETDLNKVRELILGDQTKWYTKC